jgi:class 3 adenylate cyclase/pimeloyl-ACP methyl ester carboxylesterase
VEPRIQYAKTSDGVSIAFWTLGEGMPLLYMPTIPMSHLEVEWQNPGYRGWYERLATNRKLVRYDGRGSGLSDRDVAGYSVDTHILDLEAVVDRIGLERFALFALLHAGPVAVVYAARHPERVSRLLLWCTYARGSDYSGLPEVETLRQLIGLDWETYTEATADIVLGRPRGEEGRWFAAYMRESVAPEAARAALGATNEVDVAILLPDVRSPTLVLHRRKLRLADIGLARELASSIADARLVVLEGASVAPYMDDTERAGKAIDEFLGEGEEAAAGAEAAEYGPFRTILFTDVEGSTALTQRLGDAKAREVLRDHERTVREALAAHGGSEVKTMGDGFMASFASAARALECAVAIQRAFAERASAHPELVEGAPPQGAASSAPTEAVRVRIGLNAGEPIAEEGDLFGTAVIAAARIAAQAKGGEILVSNVVRELVAGKGFLFSARGKTALRGFDDPVEVYEVRWEPPSTELRTGFDSPSAGATGGSG